MLYGILKHDHAQNLYFYQSFIYIRSEIVHVLTWSFCQTVQYMFSSTNCDMCSIYHFLYSSRLAQTRKNKYVFLNFFSSLSIHCCSSFILFYWLWIWTQTTNRNHPTSCAPGASVTGLSCLQQSEVLISSIQIFLFANSTYYKSQCVLCRRS